MFVLVLKVVVQIASLHFLLKFIATEKHFLTAKLKKAAKTTGPGLYYRAVLLLSIFEDQPKR